MEMVERQEVVIVVAERCHICRGPILEGHVYRRVMPVSRAGGYAIGTGVGYLSLKTTEPVSLCQRCNEEEARREWLSAQPGILFLLFAPFFFGGLVGITAGVVVTMLIGEKAGGVAATVSTWLTAGYVVFVWVQSKIETHRRKKVWQKEEACRLGNT